MKINGRYKGQYTYGNNYPKSLMGKSVSFLLEVVSNGIEFEGTFTDDETKDIFDTPGRVSGFSENTYITFQKTYPCSWYTDETGNVNLLEKQSSHIIDYFGFFDDGRFAGSWSIINAFLNERGEYFEIISDGSWSMIAA